VSKRRTFQRQRERQIRRKKIVLFGPAMVMNGIHDTSMPFISARIEMRRRV
jgi:hypothetical protein